MKIERLLKILFYILNRECVSATTLAKEFGVSRRTILRDIDTLTLAGIPIYAEMGSKGGYSIHSDYKINEKIIDDANSEYILLALKSLKDIYGDKKVEETYEKVKHIYGISPEEKRLEIDLSVINENNHVISTIPTLKKSIEDQCCVAFDYTNAQNKVSKVEADVLCVFYKWYAWYAFTYNHDKDQFRMYKIVRMRNLAVRQVQWLKVYDVQKELEQYESKRKEEEPMAVCIAYEKEMQTVVEEYFPNAISTEVEGTIVSQLRMQEKDTMLFAILLGFGERIKVLSPPSFVAKIQDHLEKTLKIYKNGDI